LSDRVSRPCPVYDREAHGVTRTRADAPAWKEESNYGNDRAFERSDVPEDRDILLSSFSEDELPNNTYYGDGTPIEPAVLDELRGQYTSASVKFRWEHGDVLLVDNMLTAHGRSPYRGPRQILVVMAEEVSCESLLSRAG
jgi:hypothetical protein